MPIVATVLKSGGEFELSHLSHFVRELALFTQRWTRRNDFVPPRLVCLTNLDPDTLPEGVEAIPMVDAWPEPWTLIELFKPGLFADGEAILYFRLDVDLVGDFLGVFDAVDALEITRVPSVLAHYYTDDTAETVSDMLVLEDFLRGPDTIQTHILAWKVSNLSIALYDAFAADAASIMYDLGSEAAYLEAALPSVTLTVRTFQELFPDAFLSFTRDVISPDDLLPPHVRLLVAFQGEPRPWVVDPAWAWVPWRDPPEAVESDPYAVDIIPTDYHLDEALTVTDAVTDLFVVSATADDLTLAVDEASAFVTESSDESAAAIAEAVAEFLAILTSLDEIAAAVDEAMTLEVTVASSDEITFDSADASREFTAGIATADALALDSVGAVKHEIAVDLTIADTPAIDSAEAVAAVSVRLRTGDEAISDSDDALTLAGRLYTVNEQVIGVEDAATGIDAILARSDVSAVSTEAAVILDVTPDDLADDLTLAGADVATIEASVAVGDDLTLAGDEAVVVDGLLARGDDFTLDSTDASSLQINVAIASDDDLTFDSEDAARAIDVTVDSSDDLAFDSDDVSAIEITEE